MQPFKRHCSITIFEEKIVLASPVIKYQFLVVQLIINRSDSFKQFRTNVGTGVAFH